jgi:antitoxin component YwqK of YwqJK toxin-antitoxin module
MFDQVAKPMFKMVLFSALLILSFIYSTTAQVKQSDREKANLIGKVKSVTSSSADFTGDKIEGNGYSLKPPETVLCDEMGNEVEDQMVSDFGEQMGKSIKKFDSEHQLLENVWVDPKGNVVRKDVFIYANGKLSEIRTFDDKNLLREKTGRVYDANARLIQEVYYDATKPVAKIVYVYKSGATQPMEIAFFLTDGRKATAPVGPCLGAHRIAITYDENGRTLSEDTYEVSGELKKSYRWTYNDKSNVATYVVKSSSSIVTFVYSYEYDAKGNWIKRTATGTSRENGLDVFGKPAVPYVRSTVTTRQIVYF